MKHLFYFLLCCLFAGCMGNNNNLNKKLPILGHQEVIDGDTIYHTIPDFKFINQDSMKVTNETFKDQAYIVDFFFTSCPTICPKVKQQMLRVYEKYENDDRVSLLSHSIDVRHDTVPKLKWYAEKLGVTSNKWHFITGDKDHIYDMADKYFIIALEDKDAPGGFDHSGTIILVDKNRHVRAHANGTDPKEVDQFLKEIDKLLYDEF